MRRIAPTLLIATLAYLSLGAACFRSPDSRHGWVVADTAIVQSLEGVSVVADSLCADRAPALDVLDCTGPLTSEDRQALAKDMVVAIDAGATLNAALRAWSPGDPVPVQLVSITTALRHALTQVAPNWDTRLSALSAALQSAVFHVQDLLLRLVGPSAPAPQP